MKLQFSQKVEVYASFIARLFKTTALGGSQDNSSLSSSRLESSPSFQLICMFLKTITTRSPALSEMSGCLDLLLQLFGLKTLRDLWRHHVPCCLWHAWQILQTLSSLVSWHPAPVWCRGSQHHRARNQAGWRAGGKSRGVAAWPLTLHWQRRWSPQRPRWRKELWGWRQTSWRCGSWFVTSCRRSNSCLRCWSSWRSVWCPERGCVLTTPSLPPPAPEDKKRETNRKLCLSFYEFALSKLRDGFLTSPLQKQ